MTDIWENIPPRRETISTFLIAWRTKGNQADWTTTVITTMEGERTATAKRALDLWWETRSDDFKDKLATVHVAQINSRDSNYEGRTAETTLRRLATP